MQPEKGVVESTCQHRELRLLCAVLRGDWRPGPDNALVAQLDRAPDYESGGREFESSRARHSLSNLGNHKRFTGIVGYRWGTILRAVSKMRLEMLA